MIRVIVIFIVLAALGFLAAQFADQPGNVEITWGGYAIETSLAVLTFVGIVGLILILILYRAWLWIRTRPQSIANFRRSRRENKGYDALTRGLVAVAAGDAKEANSMAEKASHFLDSPPLTLLLSAQAAQLSGEEKDAAAHFEALSEHPETEFLGVRGLLVLAKRSGNSTKALKLAERANQLKPDTPWVSSELFALQTANDDWESAQQTLNRAIKRRQVSGDDADRQKAIVFYGQAESADRKGEVKYALDLARKAHKLLPDFEPATALAARLYAALGQNKKATSMLEDGWKRNPHPDLARAYAALAPQADAAGRLAQMRKLAEHYPDHEESLFAVAEAAVEARVYDDARRAVSKLMTDEPGLRLCRLLADMAEKADRDPEAAREWLRKAAAAPADAIWVCNSCGRQSRSWTAHCPDCSSFDSFQWRPPISAAPLLYDPQVEAAKEAREEPAADPQPATPEPAATAKDNPAEKPTGTPAAGPQKPAAPAAAASQP